MAKPARRPRGIGALAVLLGGAWAAAGCSNNGVQLPPIGTHGDAQEIGEADVQEVEGPASDGGASEGGDLSPDAGAEAGVEEGGQGEAGEDAPELDAAPGIDALPPDGPPDAAPGIDVGIPEPPIDWRNDYPHDRPKEAPGEAGADAGSTEPPAGCFLGEQPLPNPITYGWTRAVDGAVGAAPRQLAVGPDGSFVYGGKYGLAVDFDPTSGTDIHDQRTEPSCFLTKLGADGSYGWTKLFGVPGALDCAIYAVAVGGDGSIAVGGAFREGINGQAGVGDNNNLWLSLLDSGGKVVWTTGSIASATDWVTTLAFAPSGEILAGGKTGATALLGGSVVGQSDAFVAKFAASGDVVWSRVFGGASDDVTGSLVVAPDGTVASTGTFRGSVDFGDGHFGIAPSDGDDAFVLELDSSGHTRWVRTFGGTLDDQGLGVAFGTDSAVFASGYFEQTVDFNRGGPGAPEIHKSAGGADAYLIRIGPEGDLCWALTWGGGSSEWATDVVVEADGSVRVGGNYGGTTDFDPSPEYMNVQTPFATGTGDLYVSGFAPDGTYAWTYVSRSLGVGGAAQLATTSDGGLAVWGNFHGAPDFDPGPGVDVAGSTGGFYLTRFLP